MNTYKKYCPNVFVVNCEEKHEKGDIITITTKYGKENEHEIHNFMGQTSDGRYLYSITRVDGFDSQKRAKNKAERINGYAENAKKRSSQYYEAAQEGRDFLVLGEPIKIGHHSERRHRKLIERNWERMGKSVAEADKAKEYQRRAEYWAERADKIDLSMPDSLEYFEEELRKAKEKHKFYKENPDKREHSYTLTYANKAVKDLQDKVNTAIRLWGTDEEIALLDKERVNQVKKKTTNKVSKLIEKYGGFYAFNDDQFREGYDKLRQSGFVEDGEKATHIKAGLYTPSKTVKEFISEI